MGRPMRCLEPAPSTVERRVGGRRLGEHARELALVDGAHVGEHGCCLLTPPPAPRAVAAVERKDLGRVQQPLGVEHGLDAHLQGRSVSLNCTRIRSRFSMPTPCSPVRQPPTATHSSRISAPACSARSACVGVVGVVEDQRDAGCRRRRGRCWRPCRPCSVADVRDGDQHLGQLAERDGAVHAVVVGDAADGAEGRLAALPDGGALLRALADAHRLAAANGLAISVMTAEQVGDLLVGALDLDDQQGLDLHRDSRPWRTPRRRGSPACP